MACGGRGKPGAGWEGWRCCPGSWPSGPRPSRSEKWRSRDYWRNLIRLHRDDDSAGPHHPGLPLDADSPKPPLAHLVQARVLPRASRGHTPDDLDPRLRPGSQLVEHLVGAPARTFEAWLREDALEKIALEVGVEGGAVTEEVDSPVGAAFGVGDPDLRQQPVEFGEDGCVLRGRGRELLLARVGLECDDQCFHRTSLGL